MKLAADGRVVPLLVAPFLAMAVAVAVQQTVPAQQTPRSEVVAEPFVDFHSVPEYSKVYTFIYFITLFI